MSKLVKLRYSELRIGAMVSPKKPINQGRRNR